MPDGGDCNRNGNYFYHRGTEVTEEAHALEPTEAAAVSITIRASTDFENGLGQVS